MKVLRNDGDACVTVVELAPPTALAPSEPLPASAASLAYLSPESLLGFTPDPRVDLWALGVLLYRCAYGRLPFRATTPEELHRALERPVAVPATFSAETDLLLTGFFDRAFAHRSAVRFQSARTMGETFRALLEEAERISEDESPLAFHAGRPLGSLATIIPISMAARARS